MYEVEGVMMCADCFDERTLICEACHEVIWRYEAIQESSMTLCRACYDDNYTHCVTCGRLIHIDDAYYADEGSDDAYCEECDDARLNEKGIRNYSYKPEPIFYGSGNLFIGVELEIDRGGECNDCAERVMNVANVMGEHIYCKHDGSLEEGFEIVTHPMTLEYHLENFNWRGVLKKAAEMGYLSHKTRTCGLHCHVNRNAFGETDYEREAVIARIVYFVEKHWNELLRFSRRTEASINRWASRYGISENTKETYKKAKDRCLGRYVAVNLENYHTVEFRLFRGTLRYETLAATLQLVDEICNVCTKNSDDQIEKLTWGEFVSKIKGKDELVLYLKSKQLYINEKQTDESEEI